MKRIEFIKTFSKATAGLILMPENSWLQPQSAKQMLEIDNVEMLLPEDVNAGWLFDVLVDVSIQLIGKGVYTMCVAGLKNPRVCSVVEWIATKILEASKDAIIEGIKDNFQYKVKTDKRDARIHIQTRTMDDALDVTAVMAHSSCNSWRYLKDIGKYPQASRVRLESKDVKYLPSLELKIMRNEIYARHGYSFHKNQDMIDYFMKQNWYQRFGNKSTDDNDIYEHFTDTEKENVELIKNYEKR